MSDDTSNDQLVLIRAASNGPDDLFEGSEDSESRFDDPNDSTGTDDDQSAAEDGHAAALVILSRDDHVFAQQVFGVEGYREVISAHEQQQKDIQESIEHDIQPGTQSLVSYADAAMSDHHDTDLAPQEQTQQQTQGYEEEFQQHAQRAHDEPSYIKPIHEDSTDRDATMEDVPDESGGAMLATVSLSDQNEVDMNDSSSLFVPEHSPAFHTPGPLPSPPHLNALPVHQTSASTASPAPSADKMSIYAKVRSMQKRAQEKKKLVAQHAASSHLGAELDPEVYLEAVTAGIRPPAGTHTVQVDEDEAAHRRALAEFQKQEKYYNNIKTQHKGRLPFRQDIEWMKIAGVESARLKKRQRDLAMAHEGDDQDPFPPVTSQAAEGDEDYEDEFNDEGRTRKRRRGEQPCKQSKPMSMQDAEIRAMQVALEANADRPGKKKKKKGAAGDDQAQEPRATTKSKVSKLRTARPSRAKATGKSTAKGPRRTLKAQQEVERAIKQTASLFNANVFELQASMGAADQPTFRTKNKAEALKELIASVPIQDKKQARNDMNTLIQASKEFDGQFSCKLEPSGNWIVRGMKTSLKGYQVLGSAFMRRRENDEKEPKGGLMADQMGLGKTLMMLANIVNSRDAMIKNKGFGPRTTLLVASPNLLYQWGAEIAQHTNCNLKVMRYGSGHRLDSTHAISILETHDIILTTYGEVMKSYPKNNPPIECQTAEEKIAWWKETYINHRGVLHQMKFKRIVLDEAQMIKNHQSRTSIACRALIADHKWALSGTPIMNGLEELYPYFKFLNVPHTGSFKIFKHNYCGSGNGENAERLLVRLSQFMIRRTHADRMFNAPILKLPQANQSTYWCKFNSVERSIYIIVQQRFAQKINLLAEEGTLERSYNSILVMLLRLRQLSAHVLMLQFVLKDLLQREDIERIKEVVKQQAASSYADQDRTILAIRKQLEAHESKEKKKSATKTARKLAAEDAARKAGTEYVEPDDDCEDYDDDDAPVEVARDGETDGTGKGDHGGARRHSSGKAFGKSYNFKPFVNSLTVGEEWEKKKEKAKCAECGKQPHKPWKTACGHLMCDGCYEEVMAAAAEEERANGTCKACGQIVGACAPCDDEDADDTPGSSRTRGKAAQKKKREKERLDHEDIADDWLSLGGKDVLPSAKTKAVKAQILNWTQENPTVKIIIYTQFLAMIRILAKVCHHEGWGTEEYHGKMSLQARDKTIKKFASDPESRILLASLRCGGLGLNLTMASRVIMIDPWWNEASEQQAFCRVFRIGQRDETFMSRLCVEDTVDERLVEMQKNKKKEIDGVMEDRGKKTKNLDIADLMRLFGNIDEADDGRPFIVVDNPAATGGFRADSDDEGYADEA
ncbi:uncharacterized protein EKO05_0009128 [Ascochyta rabiei]|uniref:ATP binding n=1 Tax=Didymella rabiei TaxID=5454 RepID=A0A163IWI5_DIDRA|nr:uncharacterized protein EKO05_0009128 [Ascochyta rabiei]KZM25989.1 ATP binding [Ascochyta rabiei]UPX18843.1 hypothetical protein EKO05_0009128 [Ascochyta rabiei]